MARDDSVKPYPKENKLMKRLISCIFLAAYILCLTSCGSSHNTSNTDDTLQHEASEYIKTAPAVTHEMNSPEYWIEKCNDADKTLMEIDIISKINTENEPTFQVADNKEITLSSIENTINGSYVKTLLGEWQEPGTASAYYVDGKAVSDTYWDKLSDNMNTSAISSTVSVSFGFTVKRTDVKASPTSDFMSDSSEDLHYDMNAVAECAPYEAVAVLHKSKDNNWYYVAAYGYAGWVPVEDVTLCSNREEWLELQNPDEFLVVTAREIRLAYDPYEPESSGLLIPMGTKLALVKPGDAPADFNGRTSCNSYIVKVPGRDNKGNLKDIYALVPVSDDVSIGYLPYTRENIINQAFKRLGDRYGWAGMYYANDCSGIAREIFACFGFEFPRNGKAQIRMTSMQTLEIAEKTDKEKLEILSEVPAGSLLYFPGHLMIYLGTDNDTPYVISAVGSMATADMAEGESIAVNSVIINSLTDTTRKTGKTWLNCITKILTCEQ